MYISDMYASFFRTEEFSCSNHLKMEFDLSHEKKTLFIIAKKHKITLACKMFMMLLFIINLSKNAKNPQHLHSTHEF